jgi:NAD(P)-dependent dehydrogenase (short-subunit alcohol dehydrogenase family)
MKNKVSIITGGSRGLGRTTAVNLARRGVDVIFTYRAKQDEANSLIREIEAMGRKAAAFRLDTGETKAFDGFVSEVRKTLQSWEFAACELHRDHRGAIRRDRECSLQRRLLFDAEVVAAD